MKSKFLSAFNTQHLQGLNNVLAKLNLNTITVGIKYYSSLVNDPYSPEIPTQESPK